MDENTNLSQMRYSVSTNDAVHNLGLTRLAPIAGHALPQEDVDLLWEFCKTQEYMFSDFERGNKEGFVARLRDQRHLHLDIGGNGYAILINAWACDTPELHFCIWNPALSLKDITKAGEELLRFVFEQMKAARVGTFIPVNIQRSIKLANLMGFRFEGNIREAFLYFEQRYDVHAYGLLRSEWEKRVGRLHAVK